MSTQNGILLHIFSGYHIGAELCLHQGKYIFGSDETCDFILSDKSIAGRHFLLEITAKPLTLDKDSEQEYNVNVTPLDGKAALNHTEIAEETVWEQGAILSAQEVTLAWAKDNMPELIQTVYRTLYQNSGANAETQNQIRTTNIQTNAEPKQNNEPITAEKKNDNSIGTENNNSQQSLRQKIKSPKNLLVLALALLTLAALVFTFTPLETQELKNTELMKKILAEQGFPQIEVITTEKGILWQGIIDNDNEQAKLYNLAQSMHFPVHMELIIKDDLVKTFNQILALEEIYPTVKIDKEQIFLGYYTKEAIYQQLADKALTDMFPKYGEIEQRITEKTIYEPELKEKLAAMQEKYPLLKLNPIFDKGKLVFNANFSKLEKEEINTLFAELEKDLGFKIAYEFLEVNAPKNNSAQLQNTGKRGAPKNKTNNANTVNFVVTGVNVDTIPFITLSNNEKIFIGGVLPNGGVLEGIGLTELTINNNGTLTIYPLRGKNE